MNLQTYFDSAASTPLDPKVKQAILETLDIPGNNNSKHVAGFESQQIIDQGLKKMAKVLGCNWEQLSIVYSGTDANRRFIQECNRRFLLENPDSKWGEFTWASKAEHSSIADEVLLENQFDPVSFTEVSHNAKLVCLMEANSETGRIYDVKKLRDRFPNVLILSDCSQSFAKGIKPNLSLVDAAVFTPQKFYGPKHIGVLYLKNPENFAVISKDSHTKSPYLVSGAAMAFEIWEEDKAVYTSQFSKWEEVIKNFIKQNIGDSKFHDESVPTVEGMINVAFKGVRGGELMTVLSREESICVSIGSACTSDIMVPTEYIKYIESDSDWQYPIRISLHKFLTDQAVADFCEILAHYVTELRSR